MPMTFSEIMQLKEAGFNPDQITALATSGALPSVPDDTGVDLSSPESAPVVESPAEVGEEIPSPSPTEAETPPDSFGELREMISSMREENKQLREMLQSNNIRDQHFSSPKPENDAASIMAKIIRPDIKERS